ncbi:MAG: metal ABC transporter ATP-binding protein [Alphaproteobacteria bacterium]|nr:metal ABC transporter ATP-binding protein [Alphaproteobacteria bacterium]
MLTLCDISAGYDRHPAVHHVSVTFVPGSLTAIVGPNGGGKSTLLKTIMGMVPLMSGHMLWQGCTPADCAYMPQQSAIDRGFPLRVRDIVDFGHWRRSGNWCALSAVQDTQSRAALQRVGMSSFADRPIDGLSVGQLQRVLFARIIVQDARMILLDEPFAPIDSRTVTELLPLLQQWRGEGRTILLVMHDLGMAEAYCPDALLLAREMLVHGPSRTVLQPDHLQKARLLAESWQETAPQCDRDLPPHDHHHGDTAEHHHHHVGEGHS